MRSYLLVQLSSNHLPHLHLSTTQAPTSKPLEKARLQTFLALEWPYGTSSAAGLSSKHMAKAGFVYDPQQANDDHTRCAYCGIGHSQWNASDDPLFVSLPFVPNFHNALISV